MKVSLSGISGDVGKWIAFVAVVLRLFFPKHFPGHHHLLSFTCCYCCFKQFGVDVFFFFAFKSFPVILKMSYTFFCFCGTRLAWDAWLSDPSAGSFSTLPCSPYTRRLDWLCHQPFHWLLPSSRTYQSVRWVQELVHAAPWSFKHFGDHPSSCLPCLGSYHPCLIITTIQLPISKLCPIINSLSINQEPRTSLVFLCSCFCYIPKY